MLCHSALMYHRGYIFGFVSRLCLLISPHLNPCIYGWSNFVCPERIARGFLQGRGAEAPAVRDKARRKRGEQRRITSGSEGRRLLRT